MNFHDRWCISCPGASWNGGHAEVGQDMGREVDIAHARVHIQAARLCASVRASYGLVVRRRRVVSLSGGVQPQRPAVSAV